MEYIRCKPIYIYIYIKIIYTDRWGICMYTYIYIYIYIYIYTYSKVGTELAESGDPAGRAATTCELIHQTFPEISMHGFGFGLLPR